MLLSETVAIFAIVLGCAGAATVPENRQKGSGQTPAGPKHPPDIRQDRELNRFVGLLLIAAAVLPALLVFTTIKHTGFSRLGDWPDVIYGLALLSGVFVAFGLRLIFVSRPLSAGVTFHNGGFAIRGSRAFDMGDEHFDWSEIAGLDRAPGGRIANKGLDAGAAEPSHVVLSPSLFVVCCAN